MESAVQQTPTSNTVATGETVAVNLIRVATAQAFLGQVTVYMETEP